MYICNVFNMYAYLRCLDETAHLHKSHTNTHTYTQQMIHSYKQGQQGVNGFPTIKFFGADKKNPEVYNGPRTATSIAQHAIQVCAIVFGMHVKTLVLTEIPQLLTP